MALAAIIAAFAISVAMDVPGYALALQAAVLIVVTWFIFSRPSPPA